MTNISRIQNLKFDDPFHSKQIGWQCTLTNTSRSDRSFNIGDIENKIIILLSIKLLTMTVLDMVFCIHFANLAVCDRLNFVKNEVSLFKTYKIQMPKIFNAIVSRTQLHFSILYQTTPLDIDIIVAAQDMK